MKLTITAYSTALFSTWINIEELNLLFDAGDGVSSGLLHKAGKIKYVFISHADRDHLTGLPQFTQLNARNEFPIIHYPKDSGSFPAMQNFLQNFDPHTSSSIWKPLSDKSRTSIRKNVVVESIRNEHINCKKGIHKSLSFNVIELKQKLKPKFQTLSNKEIADLVKLHGSEFITEEIENNIISYSGDTPVDDYSKWDGSDILIHEATFLKDEDDVPITSKENKHSFLDEVIKMASEIQVNQLILTHFSSRYSKEMIDQSTLKLIRQFNLKIPVYVVHPGEIKRNILNTQPINA